jgi:hypothetical protein
VRDKSRFQILEDIEVPLLVLDNRPEKAPVRASGYGDILADIFQLKAPKS